MSGPIEPMRNDYRPELDPMRQLMQLMGGRVSQTRMPQRPVYKDQSRVQSDYSAPRDRPQPPRARQTTSGTPSGFKIPGEISEYSRQPTDPANPMGQPTPVQFILKAIQQFDKGGMNTGATPPTWDNLGRTRNSFMANETDGNLPPEMNVNYPMLPAPIDVPQTYDWSQMDQPTE